MTVDTARSLAIDLGPAEARPSKVQAPPEPERRNLRPVRLVELLVRHLSGSVTEDWPKALEILTQAVGARAALLGREGPDALPIALATYGPVEPITRNRDVVAEVKRAGTLRAEATRSFRVEGEDPLDFAMVGADDGGFLALALWGAEESRDTVGGLLRLVVRLANRLLRSDPPPVAQAPRDVEDRGLRFPPGYRVGTSEASRELHRDVAAVASSGLSVLLAGETGTGKEMMARTLHLSSGRAHGPFVAINCAAIPDTLLEAELFGVERRVATGVDPRRGRFAQAEGGTLFLDEVGEMPPALQVKLLRVLQEREVQPLGGRSRSIDVRVVAATNRNLQGAMEEGVFRRDLYYRLAAVEVVVPPLRERRSDIPGLVRHFLDTALADAGKRVRGVSLRAMEHLVGYGWPGNIRELEHEVRRLVFACTEGDVIDSSHLRAAVLRTSAEPPAHVVDRITRDDFDLKDYLDGIEKTILEEALARTGGNQSQAADDLGLSRNGLAKKIKRFGIDPNAAVRG